MKILLIVLLSLLAAPSIAHDSHGASAGVVYTTELTVAHADLGTGTTASVDVDISQLAIPGTVTLRLVPPLRAPAPAPIVGASRSGSHTFDFTLPQPDADSELCMVGVGLLIVSATTDPEDGATVLWLPVRVVYTARVHEATATQPEYHCT